MIVYPEYGFNDVKAFEIIDIIMDFCNNIPFKITNNYKNSDINLQNLLEVESFLVHILKYKRVTAIVPNEDIIKFLNSKDIETFLIGYNLLCHHKNINDIIYILQNTTLHQQHVSVQNWFKPDNCITLRNLLCGKL